MKGRALLLAITVVGASFVSAPTPAPAQGAALPPSLFFSPEEVAAIEAALWQRAQGRAPEAAAPPAAAAPPRSLRLGAIIRFGPDRWTIWLNGERVTPANLPRAVRAIAVRPDAVTLDWFDVRRGTLVQVMLRPYQEVFLDSGEVRPFDPAAPEAGG